MACVCFMMVIVVGLRAVAVTKDVFSSIDFGYSCRVGCMCLCRATQDCAPRAISSQRNPRLLKVDSLQAM
eukprot:m.25862 g.25862  ORF g.25862 m.25862 type:complete len:70 (+) comp8775_c1_seq1:49-258(+)